MTTKRQPTHSPAFTLVEMVVAVLLLGVFMTVIVSLFNVSVRAQHDSQKRDSLLHRIDSAIATLRRDVWTATDISVDGPAAGRVDLPPATGPLVTWRYSPDGTLSRRVGGGDDTGPAQSWGDLPPIVFTAHGPLLTLTLKAAQHEETVTLVSQQMLGQQTQGAAK